MAKHGLSMDDIDVREAGARRKDMGLDPLLRAYTSMLRTPSPILSGLDSGNGTSATVGTFFGLRTT